jgi:hypothetical protein
MYHMTFDEFVKEVDSIPVPAQRLGIFRVQLNNRGKVYDFHNLKQTMSGNKDVTGFSLNHYGWLSLPKPKYKSSKVHDSEDVSIDISRDEFISAEKENNSIQLETKTFKALITW